jgi:hypothetical protein
VLVDEVVAGGVGVAVEVAGNGVEQDAALVGGVAVVVAVVAGEAAFGGGAGDDRSGTHRYVSWRELVMVGPPGSCWRMTAGAGSVAPALRR